MVDVKKLSMHPSNELFESLCTRIACLVYSRSEGDRKILSQILDSLSSLNYNNLFHVKKEKVTLLVNQCCYLIPPDETSLVTKAASLFTALITKGFITIEGKTLALAVDWCLQCLRNECQASVLKCLEALVRGNGKKTEDLNLQILNSLKKFSNNFQFYEGSDEICLHCLKIVEAVTVPSESEKDALASNTVSEYFEVLKNILFRGRFCIAQNEIIFCKFLIVAMKGIGNLIKMSDFVIANFLNEILGIIKGYMLYGLPGQENYEIQKLFPTTTTIPEVLKSSVQFVKKSKGKYDKRSKKVTATPINDVEEKDNDVVCDFDELYEEFPELQLLPYKLQTSDSDFSDNDNTQNLKIKSYESKVRHCALILLESTVEATNPKVFVSYLPNFLPEGTRHLHMRTLVTCLLEEPSSKCRSEAVRVLLILISNSRKYFLLADGTSKSSFTTFSCTISNILKELHRCLLLILKTEKNINTLRHILKCLSDLIRCTPYNKVDPSLLTDISKNIKVFLNHKDISIQIFALTVFGCIVSIDPKSKEMESIIIDARNAEKCDFTTEPEDSDAYDENTQPLKEMPWLFKQCLHNLTNKNKFCDATINVALQVESLHVIAAMTKNFFRETVASFPDEIINMLLYCSKKKEYSLRLYSGKLMETILNSLQTGICAEGESKKASISLSVKIWEALLSGPITTLIQSHEEPMLRCTGCDCLANLGVQIQSNNGTANSSSLIFEQLSRDKQIMVVTLLFSCLHDDCPGVRSSALRALAVIVLFPSLRDDSLFILDVIDATMSAARDKENNVRTQGSWLFGNLSEAILNDEQMKRDDHVPRKVIVELLNTGKTLAESGPKVKPGAVRGLGNLLRRVDGDFIKMHKDLISESLDAMIKTAASGTFMKARWNSCYAIANVVKNPLIHGNSEWMSKIFKAMLPLVQNCKNFKVRISAALVLAAPPCRHSYGDFYASVWEGALNALENSKNILDFSEYQHRDQLVDQICMVLFHLISLLELTDLNSLQDMLYFHLDNLRNFTTKFHERIVPEKSNVLLSASEKINFLIGLRDLNIEGKTFLKILQNLFPQD